jgi:hypothetical protein
MIELVIRVILVLIETRNIILRLAGVELITAPPSDLSVTSSRLNPKTCSSKLFR